MTDLHCHILPGMDDGAKDTAVSLELLRREYEDGVRNIALRCKTNMSRKGILPADSGIGNNVVLRLDIRRIRGRPRD